jgi:phosphopantothenoylcysteine decarboxylase
VIAPLSANTLAKMANGLCDNLLVCRLHHPLLIYILQTCVVRAWDFKKPLIVAPAMNTLMWDHPFTEKHLKELTSLGVIVISPIEKLLACGDKGKGDGYVSNLGRYWCDG